MLRNRRYRSFVIFSVIFGLAFLHFVRSRDWSDNDLGAPPNFKAPPHSPPDHAADTKFDSKPAADIPFIPQAQPEPENGKAPSTLETNSQQKELPDDEKWKADAPSKSPNYKSPDYTTTTDYSSKLDSDYSPELESSSDKSSSHKVAEEDTLQTETTQHTDPKKQTGKVGTLDHQPGLGPVQHWEKFPEHFPVADGDLITLPTDRPQSLPKLQAPVKAESTTQRLLRMQRLAAIKEEFENSWAGYTEYALGHDEVKPVSGKYRDPFAGWGATLVDALDTLWVMGMKDEFVTALDEVKKIDFTTSIRKDIPLFETVIRYLGGLLGAYDISGQNYPILLDKAVELAEILMGAFDTPNRMPVTFYHWAPTAVSQPHRAGTRVVLAEIGSLSMEFTRLAQLTHENKYYDAIARITNELEIMQNNTKLPGMWPLAVDASGCKLDSGESLQLPSRTEKSGAGPRRATDPKKATPSPTNSLEKHLPIPKDMEKRDSLGLEADAQLAHYGSETEKAKPSTSYLAPKKPCETQGLASPPNAKADTFGLGGQSDSTYEYLPKEHMLLGGVIDQYRSLYEISMEPVREKLLFRPMLPENRDIRFVATAQVSDMTANRADGETQKITYTYEGTHLTCFAGGMFAVGAKLFGLDGDMDIAAKLTDGCVWAYESTTTGIMPEGFEVVPCDDPLSCPWNQTRYFDIMDPNGASRIKEAEKSYERELQRAKESYFKISHPEKVDQPEKPDKPNKPNIVAPVRNSVLEESEGANEGSYASITKRSTNNRGLDNYDEHAHLSTSNNNVIQKEPSKPVIDVNDPNFVPPPKPTILSHQEYVEARLKEQRIPLGFTKIQSRKYILRPEAIESVFIMYRLTGDETWREKGWKMFEAISRQCHTEIADSAISDVTSAAPVLLDEMESFWLAETLKYFYLLFSEPDVVNLDEYVLNTEAHPFKRPLP